MKRVRKLWAVFMGIILLLQMVLPTVAVEIDYISNAKPDPKRESASELVLYKDSDMTQRYGSAAEIPEGATVYYDIVTEPGYICYELCINVYDVTEKYFVYDCPDGELEYTLKSTLAGDIDRDVAYDLNDAAKILRYAAQGGMSLEYWEVARKEYGECIMDYNCDGKVNLLDVAGVMKEAAHYDVERTSADPETYAVRHLISLDEVITVPYNGTDFVDGAPGSRNDCTVDPRGIYLYCNDDPELAENLTEFFTVYDEVKRDDLYFVVFNVKGETAPEIRHLWYNTKFEHLVPEWNVEECEYGAGWLIIIPVESTRIMQEWFPEGSLIGRWPTK